MSWVQKIDAWQNKHHPVLYDYGRILLGLFILYKGLMFISDTSGLAQILENSQFRFVAFGLAHYVAFAHLVGGILIAIGLITRVAIAFQIPILVGAVFFSTPGQGFFSNETQLVISIITLIALIFYFIVGSGYYSVDHRFEANERRLNEDNRHAMP